MDIFSALSDPTRLKIIEMLADQGQLPVSKIKEPFDMSAPAVSQHLRALLEANLVVVERRAQSRIYSINKLRIRDLSEWISRIQAGLKPTIDLSGERKRQAKTSTPIMAIQDGALSSFLQRRAK